MVDSRPKTYSIERSLVVGQRIREELASQVRILFVFEESVHTLVLLFQSFIRNVIEVGHLFQSIKLPDHAVFNGSFKHFGVHRLRHLILYVSSTGINQRRVT